MNNLEKVTESENGNPIQRLDRTIPRMTKTIHVISVGSVAHGNMIHDVLLELMDFRLSVVTDYSRLWAIPKQEPIDIVVLHNTFSSSELEDFCRLIRRRWPHAGIVLVHRGESFLEDALYDDCVVPNVAPEVLLSTIQRLKGRWQGWRSGDVEL